MQRNRFVIVFGLALALLTPGRASAWGIEWLDQLSGPGPFVGVRVDGRALCWLDGGREGTPTSVAGPWQGACVRDGVSDRGAVDAMRAYVSIEAAWASSAKNELYPTLRFDPRTEVDLVSFRPAVMFRAFRFVDAGVALGINRFSGPALLDNSFTWVSVQPRVVLSPFATSRSRVARAMEFRTDVVFIPAEVRDKFVERLRQDLGERPGSFEGGELRLMFGVDVDVFKLF